MEFRVVETRSGRYEVEQKYNMIGWLSWPEQFTNKTDAVKFMHEWAEEERDDALKRKSYDEKAAKGEHIIATTSVDV